MKDETFVLRFKKSYPLAYYTYVEEFEKQIRREYNESRRASNKNKKV